MVRQNPIGQIRFPPPDWLTSTGFKPNVVPIKRPAYDLETGIRKHPMCQSKVMTSLAAESLFCGKPSHVCRWTAWALLQRCQKTEEIHGQARSNAARHCPGCILRVSNGSAWGKLGLKLLLGPTSGALLREIERVTSACLIRQQPTPRGVLYRASSRDGVRSAAFCFCWCPPHLQSSSVPSTT
ncbi:hypothetical protein BC826DRAFT_192323 [Russula brevipes]|nr:hypothetical protein BC826DRAFT_192323 [Russula brevipes]